MGRNWKLVCWLLAIVGGVTASAATRAVAADDFDLGGGLLQPEGAVAQEITVSAAILPGSPPQLAVTVEPLPKWHIYGLVKAGSAIPTKVLPEAISGAEIAGPFSADRPPKQKADDLGGTSELYDSRVTFTAPLKLAAGTDLAKLEIRGKLKGQVCSDTTCIPFESLDTAFVAKLNGDKPRGEKTPAAPLSPTKPTFEGIYPAKPGTHAEIRGQGSPRVAVQGSKLKIVLSADPQPPYFVYALQKVDSNKGSKPTLIVVAAPEGWKVGEPVPSAPPETKQSKLPGEPAKKIYTQPISWTVEVEVPANATVGTHSLTGIIGYQTCYEKNGNEGCDRMTAARFGWNVTIGPQQQPGDVPLTFMGDEYSQAATLANRLHGVADTAPSADEQPAEVVVLAEKKVDWAALPLMLVASLVGGCILNLMPCVLPVIGLKIMSFMDQGGKSRAQAFVLNLWYSAGIIAVFLILATLASAASLGLGNKDLGWGQQFQNLPFTISLAALVFVMALSFLGVWEIPLPGFAGSGKASELATKEGAGGAFFKGVFTTILATPCSGPFLGPVFGFTISQPVFITYLVFFCIGLGMSSPYLLIGAFPKLIRYLPKPGAWMDTFKQLMGFVLLGTMVFIFSFLNKKYLVPTLAFLVGLWFACWIIGRISVLAEFPQKLRGWATALVVAAGVGFLSFNYLVPGEEVIPWQPYSHASLAQAQREGKTVMIDFTADWCLTCKTNLKLAINTPEVSQLVSKNSVVPLLADWTESSPEIESKLKELKSRSIPVLAIYPAGKPGEVIILRDLISQSQVLKALQEAGPSQTTSPDIRTAMKP